ncbi:MAG: hypothetical protein ACKO7A_34680, partial [Microcystis sp.]
QQLGCQSVALADVPDATIIPKSFVSNESNSHKIRLIVEELYENDMTLQKFYHKEAMTAINNKNNNYFRLYRICHAKLLTTHACKACTARL